MTYRFVLLPAVSEYSSDPTALTAEAVICFTDLLLMIFSVFLNHKIFVSQLTWDPRNSHTLD